MDYRYYYENRTDEPAPRPRAARRAREKIAAGLMAALALTFGATALVTPAGALPGIEGGREGFDGAGFRMHAGAVPTQGTRASAR